jgi:tetratricopeptide (TPR) repeat protein
VEGALRDAYLCLLVATLMAPRSATHLRRLGRVMRRLERFEGAKALLTRAHALQPRSALLEAQMGFLYDRDLGDPDLGSLLYLSALELRSTDSQVASNLATNLTRKGRHREAYLCRIDAYVRKPDPAQRLQVLTAAFAAGVEPPFALGDEELLAELRKQLRAARRAGEYPPVLSDDERQRIEELYASPVDPARAMEALSRPPL